ncbi:MAG: hypothetical protein JOZ83_16730 [Silvibacterium sp.]|nr:hypothetical protein [Silvibacterium sp.]
MKEHRNKFRDVLAPDEAMIEPPGEFGGPFGEDLRNFRAAVHRAAERQTAEPVPFGWLNAAKRRRHAAQRRLVLSWAAAAAFAALLFTATLPMMHHSSGGSGPVALTTQTGSDDTALLEQVDTAISEAVPSSLAPLDALDSTDATRSTNTQAPLKKSEKKNVSQ